MTVCLLLAAGSSSRMDTEDFVKTPKMLLLHNGKTLLQHILDEVKKTAAAEPLVVTGCYHKHLEQILQQQHIAFTENKNWQQGMGSSIQAGTQYITTHYPAATEIIILVCDQPHISSSLLQQMMEIKNNTGKGIVACAYDNTTGTPVLFDKKYFELLLQLEGSTGAKKIVQQYMDDCSTVDFPLGNIDIDTPADYYALNRK
ncbi:MAG: nucleotidyltransferase family protein [Ferruginibacter sp.]